MSIKESLQKIRKDLESAQAEIANLYDLVESLEKTVGGASAREATPAGKQQPKLKASKGTATERVLAKIEESPSGISSDVIIKETGLDRKTVYGILNRAKKQKKVKSPKRGTYLMA
jgi:hypothetical protein